MKYHLVTLKDEPVTCELFVLLEINDTSAQVMNQDKYTMTSAPEDIFYTGVTVEIHDIDTFINNDEWLDWFECNDRDYLAALNIEATMNAIPSKLRALS